MVSAVLSAAGLTFIFMTNRIPTTPDKDAHETAHKVIEEAITEINRSPSAPIPEIDQ